MIDLNVLLCKGCSFCVKFCPRNLLELGTERSQRGFFFPKLTEKEKCTSCGICSVVCPEGAIELKKEEQ